MLLNSTKCAIKSLVLYLGNNLYVKLVTINNSIHIMKFLLNLFVFNFIITSVNGIFAYQHRTITSNSHIIHIVTINPDLYDVDFVKARDSFIGRETVPEIAERTDSEIAINSGFFEIGNGLDGVPSKNLIIDNKIYGLEPNTQAVITKAPSGKLDIKTIKPNIFFINNNEKISIKTINHHPAEQELVLFTNGYGKKTLTNFKTRKEIAFNSLGNPIYIYENGNSQIPPNGYILSMPKSIKLNNQEKLKLIINTDLKNNLSAVSGIPLLVHNNEIIKELHDKKSSFYKGKHARTAIGYKNDGTIIIVIAEHSYKRDLKNITWQEVNSILKLRSKNIIDNYKKTPKDLTIHQLKELLEKEFTSEDNTHGLSIIELAKTMKNLGCYSAINLDGGGSTTLWIQGKVVNKTSGDIDEGNGMKILRPVSDAIVFRKKCGCVA